MSETRSSHFFYVSLDKVENCKPFKRPLGGPNGRKKTLHEIARQFNKIKPPQFLEDITANRSNPVEINTSETDLQVGSHYLWNCDIWRQTFLVQNALYCSFLAYESYPYNSLREKDDFHGVTKLVAANRLFGKQVASLFLLENHQNFQSEHILLIAFRGSYNRCDYITDIKVGLRTDSKKKLKGEVHNGFLERSQSIPLEKIKTLADKYKVKRIITCGHSLGGAVSSLCHMRLMQFLDASFELTNMTFGAPFFGNHELQKWASQQKYTDRMFHFVNSSDIVPIVLSSGQLRSYFDSKFYGLASKITKTIDYCIQTVCTETFPRSESTMLSELVEVSEFLNKDEIKNDNNCYVPIGKHLLIYEEKNRTIIKPLDNPPSKVRSDLNESFANQCTKLLEIKRLHSLHNYKETLEKGLGGFRLITKTNDSVQVEKVYREDFAAESGHNFEMSLTSYTCAANCGKASSLMLSNSPFVFCKACYRDPNTVEYFFHEQCSHKDGGEYE